MGIVTPNSILFILIYLIPSHSNRDSLLKDVHLGVYQINVVA